MTQEEILKAAAEAAKSMPNGQPASMIYPGPVPMSMQLSTAQGASGEKYVLLILQTPIGQNVYYLDPDTAEKLAEGLINTARVSRTGLEIPASY